MIASGLRPGAASARAVSAGDLVEPHAQYRGERRALAAAHFGEACERRRRIRRSPRPRRRGDPLRARPRRSPRSRPSARGFRRCSAARPRCAWRRRRIVASTAASTGSLTRTTGATPARCTVRFACTVPRASASAAFARNGTSTASQPGGSAQPQLEPLGVDGFEFPGPRIGPGRRRRPARSRSCSTAPSIQSVRSRKRGDLSACPESGYRFSERSCARQTRWPVREDRKRTADLRLTAPAALLLGVLAPRGGAAGAAPDRPPLRGGSLNRARGRRAARSLAHLLLELRAAWRRSADAAAGSRRTHARRVPSATKNSSLVRAGLAAASSEARPGLAIGPGGSPSIT